MSMKKFIEPKSDQLNADDLIGSNRIIKITRVVVTDAAQQACSVYFEGDNGKPWKPCKGSGRVLVHAWGEDPKNFVGKYVEIYRDPEAIYAGKKVGGIRVRALSDIDGDFEFTETVSKSVRKPIKILKLKVQQPAQTKPAADAPPPEIPAELLKDGLNAAAKGVAEFVKWRDALPADKKEQMRPYNGVWSTQAKAVDAANAPPAEPAAGAE